MTNNTRNKSIFISPSLNSYDKLITKQAINESSRITEENSENSIELVNKIFEKIELNNPDVISFLSSNGISYDLSKKLIEDIALLTIHHSNE